ACTATCPRSSARRDYASPRSRSTTARARAVSRSTATGGVRLTGSTTCSASPGSSTASCRRRRWRRSHERDARRHSPPGPHARGQRLEARRLRRHPAVYRSLVRAARGLAREAAPARAAALLAHVARRQLPAARLLHLGPQRLGGDSLEPLPLPRRALQPPARGAAPARAIDARDGLIHAASRAVRRGRIFRDATC